MRFPFLFILILACYPLVAKEEKNVCLVCDNGLEMFEWDLDFLRHAEQSVEVLACFFGGQPASILLKEIEARLIDLPDLQVHILASPTLMTQENWALVDRLLISFPTQFHIEFSSQVIKVLPDIVSVDNHVKMFIVDETYFSLGGTNIEECHCTEGTGKPRHLEKRRGRTSIIMPLAMRDQDIVGRGPLAHELRTIFFQLFALWEHYNLSKCFNENLEDFKENNRYFTVASNPYAPEFEQSNIVRQVENKDIQLIIGGPHQKTNAITEAYIRLIEEAQEEIILEHLYFLPIESIRNALIHAVNRGVQVTLVTNGLSEISPEAAQLFGWGNRVSYVPLFYGNTYHFWDAATVAEQPLKGTRIYEYHVEDTLLHKKIMLIDRRTVVIGSYNFSIKSAYGDYELILIIQSDEIAHDALKVHLKDLDYCRVITPSQARCWYFDPFFSYWGELQRRFSGLL